MTPEQKKSYVLAKLERLIELIVKNNEDNSDFVLAEDFIEVAKLVDDIKNGAAFDPLALKRMNWIHKKQSFIKEYREQNDDVAPPYDELLKERIVFILKNDESPKAAAVNFVRENVLSENYEIMTLKEALSYVEKIRQEFGIPKNDIK